jgi:ubiquitin C-terminal hydrolase
VTQTDEQRHLALLRTVIYEHQRKGVNKSRVQELLKPFYKQNIFIKGDQEDASELLVRLLNLLETNDQFKIQLLSQKWCTHGCQHIFPDVRETELVLNVPVGCLESKLLQTYLMDMSADLRDVTCEPCKQPRNVLEKKVFVELPPILIIQLSRITESQNGGYEKREDYVHIPFEMNLPIWTPGRPSSVAYYKLYGVTLHSGAINSGHYTSKY